jgi:hypothetical protein
VAPGIQEFFLSLTNDLEAGSYIFDEATGILWDKEMFSVMAATESKVDGFDEETGEFLRENYLGYLKREHQRMRKEASSPRDDPDWDDLYREHPLRERELIDPEDYPF